MHPRDARDARGTRATKRASAGRSVPGSRAVGLPVPRQIERDHLGVLGHRVEVEQPVVEVAAKAVQEQHRCPRPSTATRVAHADARHLGDAERRRRIGFVLGRRGHHVRGHVGIDVGVATHRGRPARRAAPSPATSRRAGPAGGAADPGRPLPRRWRSCRSRPRGWACPPRCSCPPRPASAVTVPSLIERPHLGMMIGVMPAIDRVSASALSVLRTGHRADLRGARDVGVLEHRRERHRRVRRGDHLDRTLERTERRLGDLRRDVGGDAAARARLVDAHQVAGLARRSRARCPCPAATACAGRSTSHVDAFLGQRGGRLERAVHHQSRRRRS